MRYFVLFFVCTLMACSSDLETVESKDELGYTIKFTRSKKDFSKQGVYTKLFPNGGLYEQANYVNDTLHGERKLFYENGNIEVLENYNMGKFISPYKSYFENGNLQQEGFYENNIAVGEWKKYYGNNQLMEVVTLVENEENGPFKEFYENGNKKAEGEYKGFDTDMNRPREHGLLLMYDESGTLTRKMNCNMGICRTIWTLENGDVNPEVK